MEKQQIALFWTGGLESTFRMIELSRFDVTIQPIYIKNHERKSLDMELEAMETMKNLLIQRKETKANILPIQYYSRKDFEPIDEDIEQAFQELSSKYKVGKQNLWLAQICRKMPGIERSFEKSIHPAHGHGDNFLDDIFSCDLERVQEGYEDYYVLKPVPNNSPMNYLLFGYSRYPAYLASLTKKEIYHKAIEWGYKDVIEKTWFCSFPFHGEACGYCGPCRSVVKEGLEERLSPSARRRNKFHLFYRFRHKILEIFSPRA